MIEDVDYMRQHCVKTSYVFLVDSKDRDYGAFPTPAEYVVNFSAPFNNVIGLDVLDASIPRTMYNVDTNNNQISFFIHRADFDITALTVDRFTTVSVAIGDYSIQTLIPAINAVLQSSLNGDEMVKASITVESVSTPPDVKSTVRFRSAYPFYLDMSRSTMAEMLGFDEYKQETENVVNVADRLYHTAAHFFAASTNDTIKFAFNELQRGQERTTVVNDLISRFAQSVDANADAAALVARVEPIQANNRLFHSVDAPNGTPGIETTSLTIFNGPRGVVLSHPLDKSLAQRFSLAESGWLDVVNIAIALSASIASIASIATGTFISFDIRTDLTTLTDGLVASGTVAVSSIDGTLSDSNRFTNVLLEANRDYWLVVNANSTTNVTSTLALFYNDVVASGSNSESMLYRDGLTWKPYDVNGIIYALSASIVVTQPYHVVTAPGIYSLIGERYIVLRCPEIEQHSYRSLAFTSHNMGLAKFRLGVNGYSDNRNDFSTVPGREFHPIGKLSKVTLRFERANGALYNFRGANHSITFSIKYWEAQQTRPFMRPLINPHYNPDMVQYAIDNDRDDVASEDQEDDYNEDSGLIAYRLAERDALDLLRDREEELI